MKLSKINCKYLVYLTLILLLIYRDSFFVSIFGELGKNISAVLALAICPILIFTRKYYVNPKIKFLFEILIYYSIISFVMSIITVSITKNATMLGENLFIKSLKAIVLLFSNINLICVLYSLTRSFSIKMIFKPFYYSFILLFIIGLVEVNQMPMAFEGLHATGMFPYFRMRLLTTEASFTSLMIIFFFLTSFYYTFVIKKSKVHTIICLAIFLFFLVETGSKSLLILTMVFIIYVFVRFLKNLKFIPRMIALFSMGLVIFLLINNLYSSFKDLMGDGFVSSTSFSTRVYSIFSGVVTGIILPFGTGGAAYMYFYPNVLSQLLFIPKALNFELSEIYSFIYAVDDACLAVKSGLVGFMMHYGIFGLIYFVYNCYKLFRSTISSKIIILLVVLVFIGITAFVAIEAELWACIFFGLIFADKKKTRNLLDEKDIGKISNLNEEVSGVIL